MNPQLNRLVRGYLRWCPITDGKRLLLNLTREWITPEDPIATFETKYRFRLKVNLANPEHQYLYFYGTHDERYIVTKLLKLIKPGDTCWDIGANIGFYTCLLAALVGDNGTVVAFEPAARTYGYLKENVSLNQFTNVTVVNKGLGNKQEQRHLYYSEAGLAEGTASLKYADGRAASERVTLDTIDNLFRELPPPKFVKIDVEGYQLEVLRGGEHFLKAHAPLLIAELKDVGETNRGIFAEIEDYVTDLGYQLYEIRKHSIQRCKRLSDTTQRNFFLVKEHSRAFSRILPWLR
ncbi:FkbM family methyltransferase [Candidatus Poribacteria bacterium]|nr:FkbM family methyltransferase [Candidatus Poribacteria bacterium]MYB00779.1 FkbM family methyltransferase [Candidatus Poribacteria bacterium]